MPLTKAGRKKLSDFAKIRERTRKGRFLPLGSKYVFDMTYLDPDTPLQKKWSHDRITQYSKKRFSINHFREISDGDIPSGFIILRGDRQNYEGFQRDKYSLKQATHHHIIIKQSLQSRAQRMQIIPEIASETDLAGSYSFSSITLETPEVVEIEWNP